ncbi:hypothetical protein MVEN_01116200 [Mycena venus]|uniref:Uncharacterized protein n=1 Tax=Mycena venus TaxID=2733690 RepID=A0A8H7D043_9AGAR|nr:hypothetical protein MVEN_01116200 [Mycena venus]
MHLFTLFYSISGLMFATLAAPTPTVVSSARREVSASTSAVAQKIVASKPGAAETATLTTEHDPKASASPNSDTGNQGSDVFATVDLGLPKVGFGIQEEAHPGNPNNRCIIA